MGKIEDVVFENYKTALENGNIIQAQRAVDIAKYLRAIIESDGFIDYQSVSTKSAPIGNFFKPFPYRYYPQDSTIVIHKSTILLTKAENKLFSLLVQKESSEDSIKLISYEDIRRYLWGDKPVTKNAIKAIVRRLRLRVEIDPANPNILINHYGKGYIFLGKRL